MNLSNIGIKHFDRAIIEESSIILIISDPSKYRRIYYTLFNRKAGIYSNGKNLYHIIDDKVLNEFVKFSRKIKLHELNNRNSDFKKNKHQCSEISSKGVRCNNRNIEGYDVCWRHYLLRLKNLT